MEQERRGIYFYNRVKGTIETKTYQDLLECTDERQKLDFLIGAINDHKTSETYRVAKDAENYIKQRNTTITMYQKLLYTIDGKAVPDNYTANHKCASNFFNRFVTQENQYLLGNGCTFENEDTKDKLGKGFDYKLQKLGKEALKAGVSFGFWNFDHIDIFSVLEFVPLLDEEDGMMKAGIRWWQIDSNKPLRITLYELDGYTEYIKRQDEDITVIKEKTAYIINTAETPEEGVISEEGENYPTFPIVPLYGNSMKQSELVGLKSNIDCYDLIKSGFANDLDEASMIYWTLSNAGGMDDMDLVKFRDRLKTIKVAKIDDEVKTESHTVDVPYQSRESYLTRLENDMYNDFMALNVAQIAAGAVTATQIQAAYEPMNNKVDEFEYEVIQFVESILELAGIDDTPSFTRSMIVNQDEALQMLLQEAEYLDDETIIDKLPNLTPEEKEKVKERRLTEEAKKIVIEEADEE